MTQQQTNCLVQDYFDGELSSEDTGRFTRWLLEDDGHVDEFLEQLELHATLCETLCESKAPAMDEEVVDGARREPVGRQRSRRMVLVPLAVAAGIAAVIAAAWWISGKWPVASGKGAVIARVEAASGQWTVDSGQYGKKALKVGDKVRAGDRIEVGENGAVVLAYEVPSSSVAEAMGDASPDGLRRGTWAKVELDAGSILSMRPMSPKGPTSPISKLEKGSLTAHVEKRSAFTGPFTVETPHARVEVLGTRFSVEVRENSLTGSTRSTGSGKTSSTWLHVDSGLVKFMRVADGKAIDVAAGQFAVVGASAKDFALKVYPMGTRWVEGPIIFHDDFSQGTGNWVFADASATPALTVDEPRWKDASSLAEIVEMRREGRSVNCLSIRAVDVPDRSLVIRRGKPMQVSAYVVEVAFRPVGVGKTRGSVTLAASEKWDSKGDVLFKGKTPSLQLNQWVKLRAEVVKGKTAEGKEYALTSTYLDGKLYTRIRIHGPHDFFHVQIARMNCVITDVTVWELAPHDAVGPATNGSLQRMEGARYDGAEPIQQRTAQCSGKPQRSSLWRTEGAPFAYEARENRRTAEKGGSHDA